MKRDKELREAGTLYRGREEIMAAKERNMHRYLNTWFLKGQNTATLRVQVTVGGRLQKAVQEAVKGCVAPDGGKTMVLEKSGRSIMAGLRQPDPFLAPGCQFEDKCLVEGRRSC